MRPTLVVWRGVAVPSYGTLLYLGLVAGTYMGNRWAAVAGAADPTRVTTATLLLIGPALIGSRLLFVATHWSLFRGERRNIWRGREGGLTMYGGLLVALPLSLPLVWLLGLGFAAFWDAATVTMLTGTVFGRVGCFLNGCCAGRETHSRFGLQLADATGVRKRRVPTQLFDAALALVLLAAAWAFIPHRPFAGAVLLGSLAAYGAGRVVLDRTREQAVGQRLTAAQVIAGAIAAAAFAVLAAVWIT